MARTTDPQSADAPDADQTGVRSVRQLPTRTTTTYVAVGATWILVSDGIVTLTSDQDAAEFVVNAGKGLLFVGITGAVLWALLRTWARRTAEAWSASAQQRRRYESIVERTDDVIAVFDDDGTLTYASPALERVLGWEVDEAVGRLGRTFIHPDDVDDALAHLAAVRAGASYDDLPIYRLLTPDGRWRDMEISAVDLRDEPTIAGVVVRARDVTDRRLVEDRLEHALTHDVVTTLPNQHRFRSDLRDVAFAAQLGAQHLAVLIVDLSSFREVNSAVGRHGGDEVLAMVAARLRTFEPAALGRLGADEFAIAFPSDHEPDNALRHVREVAIEVVDALAAPFTVGERRLRLSCAIGGTVSSPARPVDDALVAAEHNLSSAKQHPDRQVITLEAEVDGLTPTPRGGPLSSVHEALELDQLEMFFQPQYDLASGRVAGAEALLRWHHPVRGTLTPVRFLEDARRHGILPGVTRFALGSATRQAARWAADGTPIVVSVNLGLDDLRRHSVVSEVFDALHDHGCDPALLCIELTEHTLLSEPDRSLQAMRALRAEGVQFSIDDFGTGYSSLMHLRTLPVQELKIDQSFIFGLSDGSPDDAIVSSVIEMAHRLGLVVVAEGIEDHDVHELLRLRGCDRGQGFLMSRPVAAGSLDLSPFSPG
jgi:PAS domain S-box-containing protein/diguanylate cyclase (GGDEF)-like protein